MNYGSAVVNENYSGTASDRRPDFEEILADISQNLRRGDEVTKRLSIVAEKLKAIPSEPIMDTMGKNTPEQPGLVTEIRGRMRSWHEQLSQLERFAYHLEQIV